MVARVPSLWRGGHPFGCFSAGPRPFPSRLGVGSLREGGVGVGVVGEGRPSVPDLVAFVAFEAAAAQAVAAFEVADPSFGAGAVALSAAAGATGAGFLAAGDVHRVGQALSAVLVGAG